MINGSSGSGGSSGGGGGGDVRYPANCAARISVETNSAAAVSGGELDASILDKLYEPKPNKKIMRVITVIGYIFTVSMVAILLSLYYLFLWNPYIKHHEQTMANKKAREKQHSHHEYESTLPPFGLPTAYPPRTMALAPPPHPQTTTEELSTPHLHTGSGRQALLSSTATNPAVPSMPLKEERPFVVYARAKRARQEWRGTVLQEFLTEDELQRGGH